MNPADGSVDKDRNTIPDGLRGPSVTISIFTWLRVSLERCWGKKTRQPLGKKDQTATPGSDDGRGYERGQPLETRKGKKTDSP